MPEEEEKDVKYWLTKKTPLIFQWFFYIENEGLSMKKKNIIKKNEDYNRLIRTIKPYKYHNFIIYLERTDEPTYHFGFSTGKKIGNAVTRNRLKRQIKSILDEKNYQNGFNCIIMVKKTVLDQTFQEMRTDLLKIVENLKITKEKYDEK